MWRQSPSTISRGGDSSFRNQRIFTLFFISFVLLYCNSSLAAPRKPTPVSCPPIIADKSAGKYERARALGKSSSYECFNDARHAQKRGYLSVGALQEQDFTGWWRIRLSAVKDSCGTSQLGVGPALFVQIIEQDGAVFADYCPSLGRQAGVRRDNGIITQRTEIVKESINPLGCSDGLVEVSEHLEISRIVSGSQLYSARFVTVRRCPGNEEGEKSCTSELKGVGFAETHTIWPSVTRNASIMKEGCRAALSRCVECHENLKDLPALHP